MRTPKQVLVPPAVRLRLRAEQRLAEAERSAQRAEALRARAAADIAMAERLHRTVLGRAARRDAVRDMRRDG